MNEYSLRPSYVIIFIYENVCTSEYSYVRMYMWEGMSECSCVRMYVRMYVLPNASYIRHDTVKCLITV